MKKGVKTEKYTVILRVRSGTKIIRRLRRENKRLKAAIKARRNHQTDINC